MSATNWAVCPRCKKNKREKYYNRELEVEAAYGKVPSDKYLEMVKALANEPDEDDEETLREDYEMYVGASDGLFVAEYNGECSVCDYHVVFKHREKFAP